MNDLARAVRMSISNNETRLQRINGVTLKLRLTSIEDSVRPYFEFSEPLVFDEEAREGFCERLQNVIVRSASEAGIEMKTIEEEMTKFIHTMLLHCLILFGSEADAEDVAAIALPEDADLRVTTD